MDLSLNRVQELFALLPAYTRPTIHVAGTNGKGSVTAILSSIFTSSQISTGRFNSPHLIYVWDAITIDGRTISWETYKAAREKVEHINKEHSLQATNFEILTATAAQIFEAGQVDLAIFEVGLGGKLDATNVLPDPTILVSVITSIDLDHQQFLGDTPTSIARVKAGIVRNGKTCVLAPQKHPGVESAVKGVVNTVGGNVVKAIDVISRDSRGISPTIWKEPQNVTAFFEPWNTTIDLELRLLGAHQLQNLATALTVVSVLISQNQTSGMSSIVHRITPPTLRTGVSKARWPGRLEYVDLIYPPLRLLVDGAHNAASAAALQSYLMFAGGPRRSPRGRPGCTFILGLSHSPSKTPFDTFSPLLNPGDHVAIVNFSEVQEMPWVRNASLSEMKETAQSLIGGSEVRIFGPGKDDIPLEPLRRALSWAESVAHDDTIVLAGSLYLVADLYRIAQEQGVF